MAQGPGKYDHLATYCRERTDASAVIVIIIGGNQGHGFAVQAITDIADAIPALLRSIASDIEQDTSQ